MPVTFEDVMRFHPDNEFVFKEIRDCLNQLLPFVGAGFTAFVYGTWPETLCSLSRMITDEQVHRDFDGLIKDGYYFEAAQLLEERRTPLNFSHDLVHHFSRGKLYEKWGMLRDSAIWLLPDLFRCPVLTTNFDEAIETIYNKRGFMPFPVLDPSSPRLRMWAIRLRNTPCIFKLHGTVSDNIMDYDSLVLTKNQYDRCYSETSEMRETLKELVGMRGLFFLGCSLKKDRTVDILRDAAAEGATHYAIVSSECNNRDDRVRELAGAGVRTILYEEGKHESVRVVLRQLIEEKREGPDSNASSILPSLKSSKDTLNRCNYVPHIGGDRMHANENETRVLMIAGGQNPGGMLRLDREARDIRESLERASFGGSIILNDRWAVTIRDFFRELNSIRPDIVHFSGHGTDDGLIMLENDQGDMLPVSPKAMADAISTAEGTVRLLVFNACFTEAQAEEVVNYVEAAIGMSAPIDDQAAILFSSALYSAIGFGRSLQIAFDQAKAALHFQYPNQHNVPRLHVAEGKDASKMFFSR